MIEQFHHKFTNSFFLWFDNYLLTKGQAYTNTTGTFFNYTDERLPTGYKTFGSAYKQWVNDSSIAGATIPSGIYVNGTYSGRNSTLVLDFENDYDIRENILDYVYLISKNISDIDLKEIYSL